MTPSSLPYFALLGLVCGIAGFRLGWRIGRPLALPLVEGALGFVAFTAAWRAGGPRWGALVVGAWALGTTLISLPTFAIAAAAADQRVLRAVPYRESMLEWLRTRRGPEMMPFRTALAHARELLVYIAAALLTANLLSLVLGAYLLNTMNAYVASLFRAARHPWVVALLGWNVWSLVRVAAYVCLGSASASPLLTWLGWPAPEGQTAALVAVGAAGVVLDLALKLALSRPCGTWLGAAVDLDALKGTPTCARCSSPPS